MKHCLLLLAVVAALVVGAPAFAQFVFIDTNGDGLASCTNTGLPDDVLAPGTMNVDVYFDTNHNADGSPATCDNGTDALTINSYEFVLSPSGSGSVTFNTWTDLMNYPSNLSTGTVGQTNAATAGLRVGGTNAYIGRGAGSPTDPTGGKYKVGTLNITVTGNEVLSILTNDNTNFTVPFGVTEFGTSCVGIDFDNTYKYGSDWAAPAGACGTEAQTPVVNTTWGKIKDLYNGK